MSDVRWTLWVFAGPGAFAGLVSRGDTVELAELEPGKPLPASDPLAPLLGPNAVLPPGVEILAEVVGEPSLLQQLTGEWPIDRLEGKPGHAVARSAEPGERDLRRFVEWAAGRTTRGSRRALLVLGDVPRALGDVPAALGLSSNAGRPTYPTTIVIKKNTPSDPGTTYTRETNGNYSGITTRELLDRARPTDVSSMGSGATTIDDVSLATLIDLPNYKGTGSSRDASPRERDAHPRERDDRLARRVDALVEGLRALGGRRQRLDLLVSDHGDLAQLVALRRLAACAEVLVGSRCSQPIAARPLLDVLEALAELPSPEPEALAKAAVEQGRQRATQLQERCAALLEEAPPTARPALLTAARVLMASGCDLVALRTDRAPDVVRAFDALADQALALLGSGEDASLRPQLHRGLMATRAEGGDLGGLTHQLRAIDERHDSLRARADALEHAVRDAVVAHHQHGPSLGGPSALGVALDVAAAGELSPWSRLLDAIGEGTLSEVERRTLDDLQPFVTRARSNRRRSARRAGPREAFRWIEYGIGASDPELVRAGLQAFLARELDECSARHVGLIVRGKTTRARPASLLLRSARDRELLPITTLAQCLREALRARDREPLAMIVFDDPKLLGIEIAYELREVTHVLATGVDAKTPVPREAFDCLSSAVAARCEAEALPHLEGGAIAPLGQRWRRSVAKRLADHLAAQLNAGGLALVGIDLRYIEALCRRFDRVCQIMLDSLDEGVVRAALDAGFDQRSLITLINHAQMGGIFPFCRTHGFTPNASTLNDAMGAVYNWIRWPGQDVDQGGAPLWIGEKPRDRDPREHASYLRINTAANQPEDYRGLSFHLDVRLHALLAAWRLVRELPAQKKLWGLLSLGLASAPISARSAQLQQLTGDPQAAHYFTAFGPPPLLRLDIEQDGDHGYELRLGSNESGAVLVRQHSVVDLEVVARSLEGLQLVVSRGGAAREGWSYLESLGASLAEDVLNDLYEQIERERASMLHAGRGHDAHLALALPRELMRYPWELMLLPPPSPGMPHELLAERFALGRQMWSDRAPQRIRRDDPIRMLIVGDPRTPSGSGLPGAREEAEELATLCETMAVELAGELDFDRERDAFIGVTLTRAAMRRLLREGSYDVLHFAGHGTFDSRQPERSGWLLSDGLLTVTELRNTLAWTETPPWLIYGNACDAGMVGDQVARAGMGEIHGMADACIRMGVNAYVGPLWKIGDESARLLASEFYRSLLLQRSTIGAALRRARAHVRSVWEDLRAGTSLGDISWAGMVLFGNPTERINETVAR